MQHEEIKMLTGDFVKENSENAKPAITADDVIEIEWKKRERLNCRA